MVHIHIPKFFTSRLLCCCTIVHVLYTVVQEFLCALCFNVCLFFKVKQFEDYSVRYIALSFFFYLPNCMHIGVGRLKLQ